MDMKILFLVISAALVCSQMPPAQNGQDKNACAQAGRNAVSRCFQSNGGFQMQFVIAVLSNGSQGSLPPNSDQIKKGICQGQSPIISCVFTSVNGLRTSDQCPSRNDFIRLEQETVGLITGLQTMCGSGPLPAPSPCMSELNNNMRHCYSQVGLNPDLFTPSGSQMTGAVIGENREISGKFCRNRVNLFECMRKTLDSCPGAREIMSLSGYDHDSLEKGIDVLCHDVNVYVKGLVCLQNPSPQVQACVETMVGKITDLTARQLQQPMPMDQFYNQFCQSRIQHMECDLGAWKGQCERDAIGLKNEFECNLLPSRCRRDATLQSKLQQTCAIQNFARELRSGATSSVLTSSLVISIISFSLAFFL